MAPPTSPIRSFTGEYRFLSNFYPYRVIYDGMEYPTVEHAYQAAKSFDIRHRLHIQAARRGAIAKAMGRKVLLREDWETVKIPIMRELLVYKFADKNLRGPLVRTAPRELIEGNWWGDRFWGVSNGEGENHLGKLLMEIRGEILASGIVKAIS